MIHNIMTVKSSSNIVYYVNINKIIIFIYFESPKISQKSEYRLARK